jgi:hypothetical protein
MRLSVLSLPRVLVSRHPTLSGLSCSPPQSFDLRIRFLLAYVDFRSLVRDFSHILLCSFRRLLQLVHLSLFVSEAARQVPAVHSGVISPCIAGQCQGYACAAALLISVLVCCFCAAPTVPCLPYCQCITQHAVKVPIDLPPSAPPPFCSRFFSASDCAPL